MDIEKESSSNGVLPTPVSRRHMDIVLKTQLNPGNENNELVYNTILASIRLESPTTPHKGREDIDSPGGTWH